MSALPIAGKTGTAQGAGSYPWNDSSAFGAFSLDATKPYTVFAYLEKTRLRRQGRGARGEVHLHRARRTDARWIRCCPAIQLDLNSLVPAAADPARRHSCLPPAVDARD